MFLEQEEHYLAWKRWCNNAIMWAVTFYLFCELWQGFSTESKMKILRKYLKILILILNTSRIYNGSNKQLYESIKKYLKQYLFHIYSELVKNAFHSEGISVNEMKIRTYDTLFYGQRVLAESLGRQFRKLTGSDWVDVDEWNWWMFVDVTTMAWT